MSVLLRVTLFVILAVLLGTQQRANAGAYVAPGDLALRHDVQLLADHGLIKGVTTTWPLSWGPIIEDLRDIDVTQIAPDLVDSVERLRYRARIETQTDIVGYKLGVGFAENPAQIRSYQNTPRGNIEVAAGAEWLGDWLNLDLNVQYVDSSSDDQEFRADGSMIGVIVGNWSLAASTQERWWGPGWDGSLILSNNARPIPSVTLDRVFTDAFETKWLSWLGPWDLNVTVGQLESDRFVPDARFFGMRFNFRPLQSLEVGLTRSAQWCGDGRPCDARTFYKLLIGQDNRGGEGVDFANEPGNQLAGVDVRWTPGLLGHRVALYGQFIGEDEAGGFPSRYLGQLGLDWSTYIRHRWSTRVFAEFAGTSCQFHESSELYNCAYNHGIYQTGYRFRGKSIGHAADNDARIVSVGVSMVDANQTEWHGLLRYAALNRAGIPDERNTVTPTPVDMMSLDLAHLRSFGVGVVKFGVGIESRDDASASSTESDVRAYVQWSQQF